MSASTAAVLIVIIAFSFRAMIVGMTTYAVFWLGHSGWWFIPAFFAALILGGGDVSTSEKRRTTSPEGETEGGR